MAKQTINAYQNGGFWQELGRTTLGVTASSITVSFTAKKYLHILIWEEQSGLADTNFRFNSDSTANYAFRWSVNGASDTNTGTSQTQFTAGADTSQQAHVIMDIVNIASKIKTVYYRRAVTGAISVGTLPNRVEGMAIWGNTTNQITSVTMLTTTNNYAIGSEVIVLGHD